MSTDAHLGAPRVPEQPASEARETLRGTVGLIGLVLSGVSLTGTGFAKLVGQSALYGGHLTAALRLEAGIDLIVALLGLFVAGWAWHMSTTGRPGNDIRSILGWAALPVAALATALNLIAVIVSLLWHAQVVRFAG